MKSKHFNKFSNYYLWYLLQHNHKMTRAFHFFGLILTICFIIQCICMNLWFFLPLAWFIVYPFSNLSHKFIEKNRPAAFDDPVYAKMSDWLMFYHFLTFQLNNKLAIANRLHDPILKSEIENNSIIKYGDAND
jgi:hypothetical protein